MSVCMLLPATIGSACMSVPVSLSLSVCVCMLLPVSVGLRLRVCMLLPVSIGLSLCMVLHAPVGLGVCVTACDHRLKCVHENACDHRHECVHLDACDHRVYVMQDIKCQDTNPVSTYLEAALTLLGLMLSHIPLLMTQTPSPTLLQSQGSCISPQNTTGLSMVNKGPPCISSQHYLSTSSNTRIHHPH